MEKIIDVKQIAEFLNIPIRSVYRLIRNKEIKSLRVGRLIRVREVDFETYILGQLSRSASATQEGKL